MDKYIKVKVGDIKENCKEQDLYIQNGFLAKSKYIETTDDDIKRFNKWDIKEVFVESKIPLDSLENFDKFMREYKAFRKIYFNCIKRLKTNISNFKQNNIISLGEITDIVAELQDIIKRNLNSVFNLLNIQDLEREDEFYARLVNVSMLAMIIGTTIKFSESRIQKVGLGGILYDIGMIKVPDKITQKMGSLTSDEFKEIQKHTVYGYKIIKNNLRLDDDMAMIPLTHHEYYNGKGYPRGLAGNNIHLYSRIIAIAQSMEGMLRNINVHFRKSYSLPEAVREIMHEAGRKYDPNIVKAFVSVISIYPVGSIVILNDKRRGFVFSVNPSFPMRPVIKIVSDENKKYFEDGDVVNLFNFKEIVIEHIERDELFIKEVLSKLFEDSILR